MQLVVLSVATVHMCSSYNMHSHRCMHALYEHKVLLGILLVSLLGVYRGRAQPIKHAGQLVIQYCNGTPCGSLYTHSWSVPST